MSLSKQKPYPLVALIGRTNVGKSTLFNRLIESKKAVVSPEPGTTRDRLTATCIWSGRAITVVDTGGQDVSPAGEIDRKTLEQARVAMEEADTIILVVDGMVGPMPGDRKLAQSLGALRERTVVAVNKCERPERRREEALDAFRTLGFDKVVPISATIGIGTGDLLDAVYESLRKVKAEPPIFKDEPAIRIAFIGRPNVGKSSLVNAILGEERLIVSPIPHTTREPEDVEVTWKDERMVLIDTAGLRRLSKVHVPIVKQGMQKTFEAIDRADIVCLLIDITEPLEKEDMRLAGYIRDKKKGCIMVATKWDLVEEKLPSTSTDTMNYLYGNFPFFTFAPIILTSAVKRIRTRELLDLCSLVEKERNRWIDDETLTKFFKKVLTEHRPSKGKGPKHPFLYRIKQEGTKPPAFVITVKGRKDTVHWSYLRFLENRLREDFGFTGTPINLRLEEFNV